VKLSEVNGLCEFYRYRLGPLFEVTLREMDNLEELGNELKRNTFIRWCKGSYDKCGDVWFESSRLVN
jgi:hypothetical protein